MRLVDDPEIDALIESRISLLPNPVIHGAITGLIMGAGMLIAGAGGFALANHLAGVNEQRQAVLWKEPPRAGTFASHFFEEWTLLPRNANPKEDIRICKDVKQPTPSECISFGVREMIAPGVVPSTPPLVVDPVPAPPAPASPAADPSAAPDPEQQGQK